MKNKKIALLIPNLTGGGAERVMVILANEFVKKNAVVDLIIMNSDDMNYASELSNDINLINLNTGRAVNSIFSIRRYLRRERPDALLTTLNHVSAAASIAMSISGDVPTKFFIREATLPRSVSLKKPYLYLLSHIVKWAYNKADGIIALSEDMALKIKEYRKPSVPIYTIYNPVLIDEIQTKAEQSISPALPWPSSAKFILGVGRLSKEKDFKTLIKAISVARQSTDVKLVLLGEGPMRGELESYAYSLDIIDSLYMPGFVENPFAYMRMCSSFVLSSYREGLPNALIQALICNAPCISTNCPTGPREILKNGAYGTLVNIGDHQKIADQIIKNIDSEFPGAPETSTLENIYGAEKIAERYLEAMLGNPLHSAEHSGSDY